MSILKRDEYGRTPAMLWIMDEKTLPPKELIHDPTIRDMNDQTCAMYWLKYVKTVPPPELLHDPSIHDQYGGTCLKYWIIYTNEENIPQCLLHDPAWQGDGDDFSTAAMTWISFRKTLPPKCLLHDPRLWDREGDTCASRWKYDVRTEPIPDELLWD